MSQEQQYQQDQQAQLQQPQLQQQQSTLETIQPRSDSFQKQFQNETEEEKAERLAKQEETDLRSVYVGNVDYQSTPEQIEELFHKVGIVERVTILFDKFSGLPKGYAYVEFQTPENAKKAVEELHGESFRGRELRVSEKRTNLPGFRKRGNGFGRGSGRGFGRGGRGGRGRGGRGGRGSRGGRGGSWIGRNSTAVDDTTTGNEDGNVHVVEIGGAEIYEVN